MFNIQNMKYLVFISLFLYTCIFSAKAQNDFSFRDRLFFGGNLGFVAGSAYTDIEVSPIVGYYITPRWSSGVGVTYKYYNNRYYWWVGPPQLYERLETNIWGGRLFTNYVIVNNINDWVRLGLNIRIFAHAEYEAMSFERNVFYYGESGRLLQNSFLVGGGLRFPMGRRSSMNLTILWNLNTSMENIYGGGPIIRIGFNF